ncbi:ATP-binding protein [Bradyrhizobium sp.]|uniref:ATP-binding protein n=1 Tax=Bradyrhizobium sp. TaxID=376 RepID=UPI003C24DAAB
MFEKFVQVDAADDRKKGGTGLGLSIVKQIMLRLGGEVGLKSLPMRGSVFYVQLPCWSSSPGSKPSPAGRGLASRRMAARTAIASGHPSRRIAWRDAPRG